MKEDMMKNEVQQEFKGADTSSLISLNVTTESNSLQSLTKKNLKNQQL